VFHYLIFFPVINQAFGLNLSDFFQDPFAVWAQWCGGDFSPQRSLYQFWRGTF